MDHIREPERIIPVKGEYDTAVIGGGVAGIAAALAAARNGAKTILIEKQYMLGGLATAGIVTIYLPLCDGKGKQVSFGICEELLKLSVSRGYEDRYPAPWFEGGTREEKASIRYQVQFNASVFALLAEKLLIENGVEIFYGTSLCAVRVDRERIGAIMTENKSGREAYRVINVVDCTGDADVCLFSGEKTELFKQGNVLAAWYYSHEKESFKLNMVGFCDVPDKDKKSETQTLNGKRYKGIDGKELSEMMIDSHTSTLNHFFRNGGITPSHAIANTASIPQIRMTRRINGSRIMDDTESFTEFPDSVGMFSDWRKAGPVYEMPFSILIGDRIKNLITAGRCISVTDAMWDITRVIPVCAVSGEAAGTAAAMKQDFADIDIKKLQEKLSSAGVKLHINELEE